jgi:hypothetical protein
MADAERDYAQSGLTIQFAILDHFKQFPERERRSRSILWSGHRVMTADAFVIPESGTIVGEFLSSKGEIEQGFDIKLNGWLQLQTGEKVSLLRTWSDPRYEAKVQYPYHSEDGLLQVWNVYKRKYGIGNVVEEKWAGNAGFWVETRSDTERIYHCSHGVADPPDFESLVFRIAIKSC